MEPRTFGRTDLRVAAICLGGNVFGWTADEAASFAVLDAYVAGGGNFIDSANVYTRWAPGHVGGESETVLGRWLHARGNREQVIIATKVGSPMDDEGQEYGLSRRHILAMVEDSLRRLQTDYIDLYLSHMDDYDAPQEETMAAFDELVRQGKVRYLAASNFSVGRLASALETSERLGHARYEGIQPPYNLLMREDYERDLAPFCLEHGLAVMTYGALAGGFLTGKYRPDQPLPSSARARSIRSRYMNDRNFAILAAVDRVAAEHHATSGQVALAWLLARPGVTCPIASATTVEQTRELLAAADLRLSPEAIALLNEVSDWRT